MLKQLHYSGQSLFLVVVVVFFFFFGGGGAKLSTFATNILLARHLCYVQVAQNLYTAICSHTKA